MVHVVILPVSAHGHLIPALMLSDRLLKLGYKVTYVCFEYRFDQLQKEAQNRGCDKRGINFKLLKTGFPDGEKLVSHSGHDSLETLSMLFTAKIRENGEEFKGILTQLMNSDAPPSCIITDNMVASWAQDVADQLNLPRLVIYPSPALNLALVFHLKSLVQQDKVPIRTDPFNPQMVHLPGMEGSILSPLHPKEITTPIRDTSNKHLIEFYTRNALRIHDAAGIISNTFTELEPHACNSLTSCTELNPNKVEFLAAGPILPDSYLENQTTREQQQLDDECLEWLDHQPAGSVLFISFGSFAKPSQEQVDELAFGIEASGARFLWVLPGAHDHEVPAGFVDRVGNRGMVTRNWVPQLLVLSHGAVGGFLTHCGWNSIMESIFNGVPMLTMPFFGEQQGNAKILVDYLGVGLRVIENIGDLASRDVVEAAVRGLLENGENIRSKAGALKRSAQGAARDSPGRMKEFIDRIVVNWKAPARDSPGRMEGFIVSAKAISGDATIT